MEKAVLAYLFQSFWRDSMCSGCSGYLMELIRDHENFKGAIRNFKKLTKTGQNGKKKKWFSKEMAILTHFVRVMREMHSVLESWHARVTYGSNERHWGLQKSHHEQHKWTKQLKQLKHWFPEEKAVLMQFYFLELWERLNVFWTRHMSRHLIDLITNNENFNILKKKWYSLKITLLEGFDRFLITVSHWFDMRHCKPVPHNCAILTSNIW